MVAQGALRARLLTVAVGTILTWLAWREMDSLKQDLVPPMRQGLFTVETQLDIGTPVEETDARTVELAARVRRAAEARRRRGHDRLVAGRRRPRRDRQARRGLAHVEAVRAARAVEEAAGDRERRPRGGPRGARHGSRASACP